MVMTPLLRAVLAGRRPVSALALTASGNETADNFGVSRRTNTQGDGQAIGTHAGIGIWPPATNLNDNGNATTNITGITDTSCTTTRVTSGVVKFGTTAFNVVSSNLAANEGPYQAVNGGLAATQYTVSAWAWLVSGAATVRATLSDSVSGKQGGTAVVLTATPQRIQVTATTGALSINVRSYIETTVQQVGTWRIGGWQVEAGAVATPYIETDGADASRVIGRLQVPNFHRLVTPTQGWWAQLLVPGGSAAAPLGSAAFPRLLSWWDDANNGLNIFWNPAAGGSIGQARVSGGVGASSTLAYTPAVGTPAVIGGVWTPTAVWAFANGTVGTGVANSSIPTLTATSADVGTGGTVVAASPECGYSRWFIAGRRQMDATSRVQALAEYLNAIRISGGIPDLYDCPGEAMIVADCLNAVAIVRD